MTPYHNQSPEWVNIDKQNQHLRIYGRNSLFSQFNPSIMATRATSLNYLAQTKLTFNPNHYSQTAGLGLYYDSNNWVFARITLSDDEKRPVLRILQAEKGNRNDHIFSEVAIPKKTVEIRLNYKNGIVQFEYCLDTQWKKIDQPINVSYLSDEGVNGEPGEIGGFTGLFNFIGAVDAYQHASYADFDYYKVINN